PGARTAGPPGTRVRGGACAPCTDPPCWPGAGAWPSVGGGLVVRVRSVGGGVPLPFVFPAVVTGAPPTAVAASSRPWQFWLPVSHLTPVSTLASSRSTAALGFTA